MQYKCLLPFVYRLIYVGGHYTFYDGIDYDIKKWMDLCFTNGLKIHTKKKKTLEIHRIPF